MIGFKIQVLENVNLFLFSIYFAHCFVQFQNEPQSPCVLFRYNKMLTFQEPFQSLNQPNNIVLPDWLLHWKTSRTVKLPYPALPPTIFQFCFQILPFSFNFPWFPLYLWLIVATALTIWSNSEFTVLLECCINYAHN